MRKSGLTKLELERIVRWWIPRLGLAHWSISIEVEDEPFEGESSDSEAASFPNRDYDVARVVFNPREIGKWAPLKAHRVAVHELLHLVTREIEYVLDLLEGQLNRDVDELVTRSHRHAVEGALDRLAYRIVDLARIPTELL